MLCGLIKFKQIAEIKVRPTALCYHLLLPIKVQTEFEENVSELHRRH